MAGKPKYRLYNKKQKKYETFSTEQQMRKWMEDNDLQNPENKRFILLDKEKI